MCIDGITSEILIHMSTSITLEDLHTHCQYSGWFLCFIWWCWHWRKLVTNYSSQLTRRLCDTEAQPNWGVCKGHHCSNYRKEPQVAETRNLGQNKLYDSKDDHVWNIGDMAVCHSSSGMKAIRSCNSPADIQTNTFLWLQTRLPYFGWTWHAWSVYSETNLRAVFATSSITKPHCLTRHYTIIRLKLWARSLSHSGTASSRSEIYNYGNLVGYNYVAKHITCRLRTDLDQNHVEYIARVTGRRARWANLRLEHDTDQVWSRES